VAREWVAGIDSSTQQTKLVVVDIASGELVRSGALPHPDGTEVDPEHWWSALVGAGGTRLGGARAMSIAAQQHTTIFLDADGNSLRRAILWNDSRAREAARALCDELGRDRWLELVGFVPDAAHPVSKLRWLAEREPHIARRVETVLLPHDWLTWRVLRRREPPTTDRSDASATGYWSPRSGTYLPELLDRAFGRPVRTPRVLAPGAVAGRSPDGTLIGAGCGDNAATHLGLDTRDGDLVVSIGSSTTVSMRNTEPAGDTSGTIDTMSDARSGYIPIIAMLNGARVLSATARMLGASLDRLEALAAAAEPAAHGVVFVPRLDGERNPPALPASGLLFGLSRSAMEPATIARAAILGLGCAIADALDTLVASQGAPKRILIVGGGARSGGLRQAVADLTGYAIEWPEHREHAAIGAARQAALALTGTLPDWPVKLNARAIPSSERAWAQDVRAAYRAVAAVHQ